MAVIIRGKTIILLLLLVLGLVFLFIGFAGESWFRSEPVSTPSGAKSSKAVSESKQVSKQASQIIADSEAQLAKKITNVEFFAEYRIERDRIRSQQIEILKEITGNNNTKPEMREEAQKKLMTLTSNLEKENKLENLIRAKNYKDAVVFIQETSVTVVVLANNLTDQDTQTIAQLVTRTTGISGENIIIIPKS